jgi:hypothetical protein
VNELHNRIVKAAEYNEIQGDSKLLSGFLWPLIFKPEITK